MRISTGQIYSTSLRGMERTQSQLLRVQNQVSTSRRILTPADDPVAAAQALTVTQSRDVTAQYAANQGDASNRLALVDTQLTSLTDVLRNVRDLTIQAGNTDLADSDRQAIATQIQARFDEVLGLANSRNAQGDYLFSGHRDATTPFVSGAAVAPATSGAVTYSGDDGQRLLQVTSSQQMASGVAGSDLFMNIRAGNGSFSTAAAGNGGLPNQGSGMIGAGAIVDQQMWQNAVSGGFSGLQINFLTPDSYQLVDVASQQNVSAVLPFTPGQTIPLTTTTQPPALPVTTDFGAQVVIDGAPAAGDSFAIEPSGNQSMFQTLQDLIGNLSLPLNSAAARTQLSGVLQGSLGNLDQALANVSRVQAGVGANLQELEGLTNNSRAVDIQYQQTLSDLQDLDYAQALSDFAKDQVSLQAAQKSFVTISGLSLFSYL